MGRRRIWGVDEVRDGEPPRVPEDQEYNGGIRLVRREATRDVEVPRGPANFLQHFGEEVWGHVPRRALRLQLRLARPSEQQTRANFYREPAPSEGLVHCADGATPCAREGLLSGLSALRQCKRKS